MPALCLAKLSTLLYLRALSPESRFAFLNTLLEVFIVLWGISAEFAIAFQCRLPSPWAINSGKCFNGVRHPFQAATCSSDAKAGCFLDCKWSSRCFIRRGNYCPPSLPCLGSSNVMEKKRPGCHCLRQSHPVCYPLLIPFILTDYYVITSQCQS